MNFNRSISEFKKAEKVIPGGVNSPARAFKSVDLSPLCISHGKGSRIFDIDENEYIDYVGSWGPLILGHAYPKVVDAVKEAAGRGTSYGAPTIIETQVAELITRMIPSIDIVRMVNSGTEATMSALRLARGYTNRDKVVKFEGNYHGHVDSFLIKAGSGAMTLGLPDSPGVTKGTAKDTLTAKYNDLASVEELFKKQGDEIAAVILEPVAGNMGVVIPDEDFMKGLRELTEKYGALLIFDEVMSGFRAAKGGAQEYFGITPDLTALGKIIGGGLPVGAFGGKKEIMEKLAPDGAIYQGGTLSGNPLAMHAGYAMLSELNNNPEIYAELERKTAMLAEGIRKNLKKTGVNGVVNHIGSMMTLFFTDRDRVSSFDDSMKSDTKKYAKYFRLALESGIYLAPSQFEAGFVSYVHSDEDIQQTLQANLNALKQL
ncbi:MAG: glutamate-1-semialdehyde 2,1-aminomutase [Bacteroidales bacterium]|nr:glutamate-1-semialdehyde 2,1-aminomutase [Bacteroidales bacterium]MCF8336461.1 glutamate-1-semialdehyde 2,1-aminomutase [Bacteroidales bacterium]